jgi:hypothetical protein
MVNEVCNHEHGHYVVSGIHLLGNELVIMLVFSGIISYDYNRLWGLLLCHVSASYTS